MSVDYYTRLERGKENRPSPAVIDALAAALRLAQTEHQFDLATRAAMVLLDRIAHEQITVPTPPLR